jgi:hypothetical protein
MTPEERRENVEQTEAIQRLEGFNPEDSPQWFHDLTEAYIQGKVSAEQATQFALDLMKKNPIFIDSNEPLELPLFISREQKKAP